MRRERDDGATLVEFALVLPLLALFLFGITQFGIAFDKKQSLNAAAREGARVASIPDSSVQEIRDAVEAAFDSASPGVVTTTITVGSTPYAAAGDEPCEGNAGDTVVVETNVQHPITIPFVGVVARELESRGEFRCEREIGP